MSKMLNIFLDTGITQNRITSKKKIVLLIELFICTEKGYYKITKIHICRKKKKQYNYGFVHLIVIIPVNSNFGQFRLKKEKKMYE